MAKPLAQQLFLRLSLHAKMHAKLDSLHSSQDASFDLGDLGQEIAAQDEAQIAQVLHSDIAAICFTDILEE
jgi:hypothetical protein